MTLLVLRSRWWMSQVARHAGRRSPSHRSAIWASRPCRRRCPGRARPCTTTTFLLFCSRIANSTSIYWLLSSLLLSCRRRQSSHCLSSSLLWSPGPHDCLWVDTRKYSIIFSCGSPPPFATWQCYNSVSSPRASWESFDSLLLFWQVRVCVPRDSDFSSGQLWLLAAVSSASYRLSPC